MNKNDTLLEDLLRRMDQAEREARAVKDPEVRGTILEIVSHAHETRKKLSIEGITCRRIHKPTTEFLDLFKKLEDQVYNIEVHLTYAALAQ